ncbi:MAG: 2-hydroxyacyl-CoA dehydratase family protein [Thermodesulfobacteriota bacterium]|nr:2-hydroxyacyl-CoA dehydratase family protein [Thermodesulfobacteriota bacterium]
MVEHDESRGLTKVKEINQNRTSRAKELRTGGKKVIGYFCIFPPLEMITALDMVPYRILGDISEPITKADSCLPTVVCPFIRSCLDLGLKEHYDFLDGIVWAHSCDVGEKTALIWKTYLEPFYFHYIDLPHTTHGFSVQEHKAQIIEFKETLESFAGVKLTQERLRDAIQAHNKQRSLVRELYELRKSTPPLISGVETLETLRALMSIPVDEGNVLLEHILSEVRNRKNTPHEGVRLLVWGSIIDNSSLIEMIEELGANIVMDDTCVGSRAYFADVEHASDSLDSLAHHYLVDIKCPRTFRGLEHNATKKDYFTDLESRFGYLRDYAREWDTKGVILQSLKYCDIHGYEVPGLKDYFDSVGLPSIYIEHDYNQAALAPLRTRIQAFLEIIS